MLSHLRNVFAAVGLAVPITAGTVFATTNPISGTITGSVTWSGTNLVTGTVTVQTGAVVTVAAGTTLLMGSSATLVVNGQLLADGMSNAPILFTRAATGQTWSRLRFVRAQDSLLRHCIFEFANSAGTHLDYYDDDCNTNTPPPNRTYHEAIVALATRLEVDGCVFRNLPDTGAAAEGDALAIVSDDPQFPGTASAHIRNCRFVGIGQAIHTRYSHVLVEGCLFSGKRGDNDDVDLYGESDPVPLIRHNTFLSGHEDKINPTRCSAIIMNNFVSGSDDHGIVLRDKGRPIVFNNIISNCTAAAISVQNQCDALIANNTIVNCGRGVRLFDHTARHGPPYCLFPGNGQAIIVNNIIWDWTIAAFAMEESSFQPYPQITVLNCNVEAGANLISTNGANNTVVWGPGNLSLDPQFTNALRLRAASPCIDAGTNVALAATNFNLAILDDYDGVPRPLDGDGDASARFDIGAYEFLRPTSDSNGDGIPDGWTWSYLLNPADPAVGDGNPDADAHTTRQEWVADTNPTNAQSLFQLAGISNGVPALVQFLSSSNRLYTLFASTNVADAAAFAAVPGQSDQPGTGGLQTLVDTNSAPEKYYRVGVRTP